MKILQTPIRFYPYIGGVENHAYYLSRELVKLGHDVKVICANQPKGKKEEIIDGIKIQRLWYPFKIQNTNITFSLPLKLCFQDVDIIHTYFPSPWSSDWSTLMGKVKKIPVIFHYYNDLTEKQFIRQLYNCTQLKLSLRIADKIIIPHEKYIDYSFILPRYREKLVAIPPGVNLLIFRPDKTKNIKKTNPVFGFASVLSKYHEYKGLNYLLEAWKSIDANLKIVGDGEMSDFYKVLAAKSDVSFLGSVPFEKMPEFYRSIDVFILPTTGHKEGFGIVALEAMACGIPVIVTSIVGIAEDIEKHKCGIVIEPKNMGALKDAVRYFLDNPSEIKRMGKRARKVALNYSWKKIAKRTEKLYRDVINENENN